MAELASHGELVAIADPERNSGKMTFDRNDGQFVKYTSDRTFGWCSGIFLNSFFDT